MSDDVSVLSRYSLREETTAKVVHVKNEILSIDVYNLYIHTFPGLNMANHILLSNDGRLPWFTQEKNIYNIGFHRRGMSGNLRPSLYSASSVQILNRVKLTLDSGFGVVVPSLRLTYFVFF
jgi:hypothetical protein